MDSAQWKDVIEDDLSVKTNSKKRVKIISLGPPKKTLSRRS